MSVRPGAPSQYTASLNGSWLTCPSGVPSTANISSASSMWSGRRNPATGLTCDAGSL
jgi:hypothetical protein